MTNMLNHALILVTREWLGAEQYQRLAWLNICRVNIILWNMQRELHFLISTKSEKAQPVITPSGTQRWHIRHSKKTYLLSSYQYRNLDHVCLIDAISWYVYTKQPPVHYHGMHNHTRMLPEGRYVLDHICIKGWDDLTRTSSIERKS